ncbi:hypothetical protein PsorP6_002038 [Peronosclerospora sorghi]|uniref:Uncharacterized protein n=1 Tax=Peronosclerospora sorghi TaxID=230839 RepID=A0ACC0WX85_9STRA|nr:hypothetical protein PsorP6_002038 [Peronosclerospora sorghi]
MTFTSRRGTITPSSGLESEEQRLRESILYTPIFPQNYTAKKQHEHRRTRPSMSKEAMALVADLVYKQAEGKFYTNTDYIYQIN